MAPKMMYNVWNSTTNLTLTKKATTRMMTHEQIQQMFSEESDDEFLGFESIYFADFSVSCVRL